MIEFQQYFFQHKFLYLYQNHKKPLNQDNTLCKNKEINLNIKQYINNYSKIEKHINIIYIL